MADRAVDRSFLRYRQKSRRIESKTGSARSDDEESYSQMERTHLRFIRLVNKYVSCYARDSSSLTRWYEYEPFEMEKLCNGLTLFHLFARVGPYAKLMRDSPPHKRLQPFFGKGLEKYWRTRWSPLGSYFVASDFNMVGLWGSKDYVADFSILMCYNHCKVDEFDLSPGEKYLVTYSRPVPSDPKGIWLKIFKVTSGKVIFGLKGGFADAPQWPVIRWAGGQDDKYFAILSKKNTVSVYQTDTFSLLGKKPLDLDDVVDISWSPTESLLALLLKGRGKQPAKALLFRIPDMVKLAEMDLPAGDCKMHWQSNGEYLAINMYSGFGFFCIKEEGIPKVFLELDKKKMLVAFAWEPSGHRFALIHQADKEQYSSVCFYSMETTKVTVLHTLLNKQADALFWSPRGKLIVLAGFKECFGGKLQFFDVDQRRDITKVMAHSVNHVAWDPSGRYVATATIKPDYHSVKNDFPEMFHMWSSNGDYLYGDQCDFPLTQLDWRPYGGGIINDELLKERKRFLLTKRIVQSDEETLESSSEEDSEDSE